MYQEHIILVCIPAYKEENFIGSVIKLIPEVVDNIIVIDDCSPDNTAQAAKNAGDPRVTVISLPINSGVGGAVISGYQYALEILAGNSIKAIIVKMDGDGQMDPTYLTHLLDAIILENFDYAKGNRFLSSNITQTMPALRVIGNIVLTFLTKLASGYWQIFDPQNGYTAIRISALRALPLQKIYKRYFFENDMLIHLNIGGFKVKDVIMPAVYGDEQSDLSLSHTALTFPGLLIKGFIHRIYQKYILRDFSPIALFLILGSLMLIWSFIFGCVVWLKSVQTNIATPTGTIMLVILPLIFGFQLFLQAITLDIQNSQR